MSQRTGFNLRVAFFCGVGILLLGSCMIVPPVSGPAAVRDVSLQPQDIYPKFHMSQAAWRRRDVYRDSGWMLEYDAHAETNTQVLSVEEDNTLYVVFRGRRFRTSEIDRRHNTMIVRRRPEIEMFSATVRTPFEPVRLASVEQVVTAPGKRSRIQVDFPVPRGPNRKTGLSGGRSNFAYIPGAITRN